MHPTPTVLDLVLRLVLTAVTAGVVGLDRNERGRAAGLRTTMLVGLAAAVAMLQADLLLPLRGKGSDSYVVLDLMRLPLGILSGMGFIGAAAVFRRDDLVLGVTTAATLWFVSVMGLCFGGGQIVLGVLAFGACMAVLSAVRALEVRLRREQRATLHVVLGPDGPTDDALRERLLRGGVLASRWSLCVAAGGSTRSRSVSCQVRWRALPTEVKPPAIVDALAQVPGVLELRWEA